MAPLYQSIISSPSFSPNEEALLLTSTKQVCANDGEHANDGANESPILQACLRAQISKRPLLVFSMMLLLACTVGHTLTVMYYWENIKSGKTTMTDSTSSTSTTRDMEKDSKHKAQHLADEQKKQKLVIPSLKSEAYYNVTLSSSLGTFDHDEKNDFATMGNSREKSNETNKESDSPPPPPPPHGCQATLMIIRHCEKGGVREHCNPIGFERAEYISTLFGHGDERWPAPSFIYALSPGDRNNDKIENWREVETVKPLSDKLNVPIDYKFGIHEKKKFANDLLAKLRDGNVCGKIALISWKHDNIPELSQLLGCGPDQGCPTQFDDTDFDSAWQIRYTYKKPTFSPFPAAEAKEKKHKSWGVAPEWSIYGKVEKEGFDPLAFSKEQGTY